MAACTWMILGLGLREYDDDDGMPCLADTLLLAAALTFLEAEGMLELGLLLGCLLLVEEDGAVEPIPAVTRVGEPCMSADTTLASTSCKL